MTKIIARAGNNYLAVENGEESGLAFATRWNGREWVGYERVGSWVAHMSGLRWVATDTTPAEVGLPEPPWEELKR